VNELQTAIIDAIKNQQVAISAGELRRALSGLKPTAQQLTRALAQLQREGRLTSQGNTRARRYLLVGAVPPASAADLPLSPEAHEAIEVILRPLSARAPVSYRREWLDAYVPGETSYLPAPLRERLRALGQTAEADRPAGTYARQVLERFLLDLSWNSARLEGNTYSLLDTERLLSAGAKAEGKSAVETQMLLNHKAAIEFLVGEPGVIPPLEERTLKALHALLMENLFATRLDEGRLRALPVQISASVYLPLANPQQLEECFRQVVLTAQRIDDPYECSFFLLVHLPYLQPFLDGNKRTARLAANLPYVLHNLVPLSFVDVPAELFQRAYLALCELRRIEPLRDLFAWGYERSAARLGQVRASLGEPDLFRLEHRQVLRAAVRQIVQERVRPAKRRAWLERFSEEHLAKRARIRFVAMAEQELAALNEITSVRYGLRPSELAAWAQSQR
jgi:fido (protein-threonine AMPylation protein)